MRIRPAEREDAELLFGLIRELAEYEKPALSFYDELGAARLGAEPSTRSQ